MTFDPVKDIREFHEKFMLNYDGRPAPLEPELLEFRARFMQEELDEYNIAGSKLQLLLHNREAWGEIDNAEIAHLLELQLDALVDLVYVVLGTSYLHGFDFKEAWRRVHDANMQKVRAERASDSKRGSTYDVVKPDGWEPPSHTDLVENHVYSGV